MSAWHFRIVMICCLLASGMLAGGCASHGRGDNSPPASLILPEDKTAPPLTPKEKAVLRSTGQIDRNVPEPVMDAVERQYHHFLRRGRPSMDTFSRRAEKYLAYARRVFRERGMPDELAYLAIVESGYRPNAKSPAGAVGAWQFMPYTGKKYGLEQDQWVDERLDPYAATEAAASYLQKLYGDFGDWPTAIAAYNAGEGKMQRAMEGTGGDDLFDVLERNHTLPDKAQLREETKQYVPRFMAVTKIMRNLPQLDFAPINPEQAPAMIRLTARPGTDLKDFSQALRMDWGEFQACNLQYKRHITPTDRSSHVYVPAKHRQAAAAYLQSPKAGRFAGWRLAAVTTNADSWEKISRRANVSTDSLKAANPGAGRPRRGAVLLVPGSAQMSAQAVAAAGKAPAPAPAGNIRPAAHAGKAGAGGAKSHRLKADETLYAVAGRYRISLRELQEINQIKDPNMVRAGTVLRIPGAGRADSGRQPAARQSAAAAKDNSPRLHTVQERDSLWNIARKYNVSVDDLKRWNNVEAESLRPGSKLVVNRN